MIPPAKPVFIKPEVTNVNYRWVVNSKGEPSTLADGVLVGDIRGVITRGYAGIATSVRRDGYLLCQVAEMGQYGWNLDQHWISEQYLTTTPPPDLRIQDKEAIVKSLQWLTNYNQSGYGINPWGKGHTLNEFEGPIKTLLGFAAVMGLLYAASDKK